MKPILLIVALCVVARAQSALNAPTELSGLYYGYWGELTHTMDFNGNSSYTSEYRLRYVLFMPGARYTATLPSGGLEAFACQAPGTRGPCAPYQTRGDAVALSNGQVWTRRANGVLQDAENAQKRLYPARGFQNWRINARYANTAYTATTGVAATNALTYTFSSDGTFKRQSASTVSGNTDPQGTQTSSVQSSYRAQDATLSGTYRFQNNTLELTANGTKIRLTALPLWDDAQWIVIEGRAFKRLP